jgi:putative colanic acid biosynthesis acetyltransferase WcaF
MNQVDNASYKTTIHIGASRFIQITWYLINIFFFKNPLNVFSLIKVSLLKLFRAKIGKGVIIKPSVNIKYPWKLKVGDHCWIGEHAWIDNLADVEIGRNVCISQGAMLLTGNHDFSKSTFDLIVKPIIIEDGAWIGSQAIVCPGVTCGSHSVLSAGSVATQKMEPYKIYQGNPAIFIKERVIQ